MGKLKLNNASDICCNICGLIPGGVVSRNFICTECIKKPPSYDSARHALSYTGNAKDTILRFKYNKEIWLVKDLADILEAASSTYVNLSEIDCVIPVPLHQAKFIIRSFNQAELLAKELAKRLRYPCLTNIIKRVKDTPTQTKFNLRERKLNIRHAFRITEPRLIHSRRVLLIDDIMTTGSTLNEIAHIMKNAGADSVHCLALARGEL